MLTVAPRLTLCDMESTVGPTTPQPVDTAAPIASAAPHTTPVLVTEQQVLFSTAAAARRQAPGGRLRDALRGVVAAVRHLDTAVMAVAGTLVYTMN
jgi:hypothetical protein